MERYAAHWWEARQLVISQALLWNSGTYDYRKQIKKRWDGRFELGVSIFHIETFFDLVNSLPSALPFAAPES